MGAQREAKLLMGKIAQIHVCQGGLRAVVICMAGVTRLLLRLRQHQAVEFLLRAIDLGVAGQAAPAHPQSLPGRGVACSAGRDSSMG